MLEDYCEEEEEEEQQPASAEVATNNGQRNQPNFSAVCVLLTAKERPLSAPGVTWAVRGALFRGISHKSKFVIYHPLCEYCVS
jgi:hypothetical protein